MLARLLSSFDPVKNPIGFGASDFIEFTIAALFVALVLIWRPIIEPLVRRCSPQTRWCMVGLAILPVALRLALLSHHPVPSPDVYDEFGHLFVADTLRHFRLANPPNALPQFFETFFILQTPTYSSIYPIGQGVMLAIGRAISGVPMGRRFALDVRIRGALLLDAARVDERRLGRWPEAFSRSSSSVRSIHG